VLEIVGAKCAALLDRKLRNLTVGSLQIDELWARVGVKEARRAPYDSECGDFYTFLGIDARTKLIVSHHTGKRDYANTDAFVADLASRIVGRVQITTDGWQAYPDTIRNYLLYRLDYAVMQKIYSPQESNHYDVLRRYSPPACTGVFVKVRAGAPRRDRISTSFVERANLSVRLGLGWSRKLANHKAAISLFVAAYNFCKVHNTLGCTPAVGAKLTDHNWTIEELVEQATPS
jgi:IS1 family transposase